MITDKELEKLAERFASRMDKVTEVAYKTIGNRIKKIGKMSVTDVQKLNRLVLYTEDMTKIVAELHKQTNKNISEIEDMYKAISEKDYKDSKKDFENNGVEYIPYKENNRLKLIVDSVATITEKEMKNISRTTALGFRDYLDNEVIYKGIAEAYQEAIDVAITSVATGVSDYQTEMYKILKPMVNSGIRTIDYASGYSRRLDSSVRQAILTGTRRINQETTNEIGRQFGADGYEITAHGDCAPDHLHIQGRQYTEKEFNKLNNDLERPVGELNCKHFAYPVVIGVSSPSYSRKQLKELERESTRKIEYEGKTYTAYEATQVQRKLETQIRQQKESKLIGNEKIIKESNAKIRALTAKYKDFSNKAGLPVKMNRLRV